MKDAEFALAEKLLRTLHLNVPERAHLAGGRMRFSVLVEAAERFLASRRLLPEGWTPAMEESFRILELRDDGYWIHSRDEIGYLRFSPLRSRRAPGIRDAVRSYLKYFGDGASLDGIPIAWEE